MRRAGFSIRTLIAVPMALVISFFVLITGLLVNGFVSKAIEDNAMDSASEIVTQVNSNLSTYISDILDVSDYARELGRTTALSPFIIQSRLEALINSRDDLVNISAFALDGTVIVSTEPDIDATRSEILSSLWFRRAVDGEGDFFFTGPHRNTIGERDDVVISYSTIISYGDINRDPSPAVLLIDLNFNAVEELLESVHLSQTGYAYIISNDGDIVYHPKEMLIAEGSMEEDLDIASQRMYSDHISQGSEDASG